MPFRTLPLRTIQSRRTGIPTFVAPSRQCRPNHGWQDTNRPSSVESTHDEEKRVSEESLNKQLAKNTEYMLSVFLPSTFALTGESRPLIFAFFFLSSRRRGTTPTCVASWNHRHFRVAHHHLSLQWKVPVRLEEVVADAPAGHGGTSSFNHMKNTRERYACPTSCSVSHHCYCCVPVRAQQWYSLIIFRTSSCREFFVCSIE